MKPRLVVLEPVKVAVKRIPGIRRPVASVPVQQQRKAA